MPNDDTVTWPALGPLIRRNEGLAPSFTAGKYSASLPRESVDTIFGALYGAGNDRVLPPRRLELGSCLCTQAHFGLPEYRYWVAAMGEAPRLHRKLWEWFYIAQSLFERGLLGGGQRGLGFAVGTEPLPALFASLGCEIMATDQPFETAGQWTNFNEHAKGLAQLARPSVCAPSVFEERVRFHPVDMNHIPGGLVGFDFCWSACSLEHLGSLEHGVRFIERAMDTLKPGGVAVHTTEFNLSSDDHTMESEHLSIYRQKDILELTTRLSAAGHHVAPLNLTIGGGFIENLVDLPPYNIEPSLRIRLGEYDCTSFGIVVTKAA